MDSTPMSHQLAVLYAFSCSADIWSNLTTEGSGYHLQAQQTRAGEMCMNSDVICSTHNSVQKARLPQGSHPFDRKPKSYNEALDCHVQGEQRWEDVHRQGGDLQGDRRLGEDTQMITAADRSACHKRWVWVQLQVYAYTLLSTPTAVDGNSTQQ